MKLIDYQVHKLSDAELKLRYDQMWLSDGWYYIVTYNKEEEQALAKELLRRMERMPECF